MATPEEVVASAGEDKLEADVVAPDQNGAESKFPEPVPEDWKAGRAARAEQWFKAARDTSKQ